MLRDYQAARELERIANLSAFNVAGYDRRRKLNQHACLYAFPDGSTLEVRATKGLGSAWHQLWQGQASDVHLGPVVNLPLRINRQS